MPTLTRHDRDESLPLQADAGTTTPPISTEDTGTFDLGDLWRDVGGMG